MRDEQARRLWERFGGTPPEAAADPDRPRYHFLPPPGWMNDPVPCFGRGEYHVFFQYNPGRPFWGDIHWGHASTPDLLHWRQLPNALAPSPGGPDAGGCWTGCVVEDGEGFHALYTGVEPQVQCLAHSPDLLQWTKDAVSPVLPAAQRPTGIGETFRDPCVWREDGLWRMVLGADLPGGGGSPLLFCSRDLRVWEYLQPLCQGGPARDECPDLFPLQGRHVLLSSRDQTGWAVGGLSGGRFAPLRSGLLDDGVLYAAKTLLDGRGRRIAFGWLREARGVQAQVRAGWSGVLSLPRVLHLGWDGALLCAPPEELLDLRGELWEPPAAGLEGATEDAPLRLQVPTSGCFEVEAEFAGLPPGGAPGVLVPGAGAIVLPGPEDAVLRLFVDRSVVEVFSSGGTARSLRAYTADGGGAGWVGLFRRGGRGALRRVRIWDLGTGPAGMPGGGR